MRKTISRSLLFVLIATVHPAVAQSGDTAEYRVTFKGNWTLASTPGGVVSSAHFTTIAGGTHNSSVSFWSSGSLATSGLEGLAELGSTSGFLREIRASSHSDAVISSGVSFGGTGTSTFTLTVKKSHPLVTLATMIGPSPDWFVGLSGFSLVASDSEWINSANLNLYPYDAGTEEGTEFTLSNPPTSPQEAIASIRGEGKFSNEPMAIISFTLQGAPPAQPPPFISSIQRPSTADQFTNADTVTWLVSFNEAVRNVSADDFVVNNTTATVTSTSPVSGSTTQYELVVSGGDLGRLDATISLGLSSQQNITSSSGVALRSDLPTTNQTYVIDNTAPQVASFSPNRATSSPFTVSITFNEVVRNGALSEAGDVTSADATLSAAEQVNQTYRIQVSPVDTSRRHTISLAIRQGAAIDLAGNRLREYRGDVDFDPDVVEATTPVVAQVAAISPDGIYRVGDLLEIAVEFSELVTVTGTPTLTLRFDFGTQVASYDRGSGSNSLIFGYVLVDDDSTSDLAYEDSQSLRLAGGSIVGQSGASADLTLPFPGDRGSLSSNSNIVASTEPNLVPSFGDEMIENLDLMMNQRIEPVLLPLATGGDGTLQYRIEPTLPVGLQLDVEARTISGRPEQTQGETTYSWIATDEDGDTATLTFSITITERLQLQFPASASIADRIYIQNDTIEPIALPSARGGEGTLTYTLSPELPAGLSLDVDARTISGASLDVLSATEFTWQVEDERGETAVLTFRITVQEDLVPEFSSDSAIPMQLYRKGVEISPLELPRAQGGNGDLSYQLRPALPNGLQLDAQTYTIEGTPTVVLDTTSYSWLATDDDGDETSISFSMRVIDAEPLTFADDAMVGDKAFIQGSPIKPIALPRALGGYGNLDYSLSPNLPEGLVLDRENFEIEGTPEDSQTETVYSWRVSDELGMSIALTFSLTIIEDQHPRFGPQTAVPNQSFTQNSEITPFVLPTATGGNGQLVYSLDPALPDGLNLDLDSFEISGTPSMPTDATVHTWSVTDDDGDSASLEFELTVIEDLQPAFEPQAAVPDRSFIQDSEITPFVLPTATGGNGQLVYSLSPTLPDGLNLDSFEISGTPSMPTDATVHTWSVTDDDGDSASLEFELTVIEDLQPAFEPQAAVPDRSFIQDSEITPFVLPTATGGNGQLVYSLDPALPDGLNLDLDSFEISGTPSTPTDATVHTWSVTDDDGDVASLEFELTVIEDLHPAFEPQAAVPDRSFIQDSEITPFVLPTAMGGNGQLVYSLDPTLPDGLNLDLGSFEISGTPSMHTDATVHTWSVTDDDGDSASLEFELTVIEDLHPAFEPQAAVPDRSFIQDSEITPFVLPTAMGGNGQLVYSLDPTLPEGLSLDLDSFEISGTPSMPTDATVHTWSVTDDDGDVASLEFELTVIEDLHPVFDESVMSFDRSFVQNSEIEPLMLPAATGGNGELSFSLSPELPDGLHLDVDQFVISGIPTVWQSRTEFVWTVTDVDGDNETFQFYLTIFEDLHPTFAQEASVGDREFITDSRIEPIELPAATGGNGNLRYTLTPALPNGLDFDSNSLVISGTPLEALARTRYTWMVEDEDGDSSERQFYLTVFEDVQPMFATTIEDQIFVAGLAIRPVVLPRATGGNGELSYELTPQLPNGLSFDAASATIRGTPTEESPEADYSWTATDIDGDMVSIAFSITIHPAAPEVVSSISDVQLVVGGNAITVDANASIEGTVASWNFDVADPNVVSVTSIVPGVLVISPLLEGRSVVTVTASNITGSVEVAFSVMVTTDLIENEQIETAFSLQAGALLSGAQNVFKKRSNVRLHSKTEQNSNSFRVESLFAHPASSHLVRSDEKCGFMRCELGLREPSVGQVARTSPLEYSRLLNFSHASSKWSGWGAFDLQNFTNNESANEVEGTASSLYFGFDMAVTENIFAGIAVGRHNATTSYEFTSVDAEGAAEIDTSLTGFYPYLQLSDGERYTGYVVGGTASGESQIVREHANRSGSEVDSDLSLIAGGFDAVLLKKAAFDISIVGDAGVATISTSDDPGILANREYSSSKASIGGSISFRQEGGEGGLVLATDVRLATGAEHEESGTGYQAGVNLSYWGDQIDIMLDGRVSSLSSDVDISRNSISGRIRYKSRSDESGFQLRLVPKWQRGSEFGFKDSFALPFIQDGIRRNRSDAGGSIEGELGYGFWTRNDTVLLRPTISWQQIGSRETELRIGPVWEFNQSGSSNNHFGFDLTRGAFSEEGTSYGIVTRVFARW